MSVWPHVRETQMLCSRGVITGRSIQTSYCFFILFALHVPKSVTESWFLMRVWRSSFLYWRAKNRFKCCVHNLNRSINTFFCNHCSTVFNGTASNSKYRPVTRAMSILFLFLLNVTMLVFNWAELRLAEHHCLFSWWLNR